MSDFFSRIINFVKNYPGVLYSFLLILVLPLLLCFNAYLTLSSFQKNIDYSLQTKALSLENILAISFSDYFDDTPAMQKKISEVSAENLDIKNLTVLSEVGGGKFRVIAAENAGEIGTETSDPSFAISYSQDQAIASLRTKDGERFWNVIKPVYDKNGEKRGLIGLSLSLSDADTLISRTVLNSYIIVFITIVLSLFLTLQHTRLFGYVSLSKKLGELDKMKDDFIRMTTHELRTPIVTVRGYIDMLESDMGKSLSKKKKESFEKVKIASKNLNDLIDDILEVSRLEQGRLDFETEVIYPAEKIKEIIKELDLKAQQKKLKLVLEMEEGDYRIKVNVQRFRQIIFNLIENSIKYTPSGSVVVSTKVSRVKEEYIIEIKDTGLGISAEAQKHLFERFYRVKTEKTSGIPGTGLGLWIVKQICEKMGGRILLESMEGAGTKFTVVFPLSEKTAKA